MRLARLLVVSIALFGLVACSSGRRGGGGGGEFSTGDDDDVVTGNGPVSGLDLVGLSVNQGVEIELLAGTDWIDNRNADVIAGRPGLLRVYVQPQGEWEPRDVLATLEFDDGRTITIEESVSSSASSVGSLNSTLNFELEGDDVVTDVGFSVRLEEAPSEDGLITEYDGTSDASRWPREDDAFEDLDARSTGVIDLRIVPVRYNADNSGRLPDTSDNAVEIIREEMMKLYPASEIRVSIEPVMDWNYSVPPNGSGWSELLQQIYWERDSRNMPGSSYTYGLFAPAADRYDYCGGGCVAGLSINVQQASYSDSRVSIGLGYGDLSTAETMAHEIGHAHGRNHAPCTDFGSIQNVDPSFPHSNARLGVYGYDIIDGQLKDPNSYADLMAYCDPIWVSDYTWNGFGDRIRAVGPEEQFLGEPVGETMSVIVSADGLHSPVRQAGNLRFIGGAEVVKMLDADGFQVDEKAARFLPFDHIEGGMLVFGAPAEGVRSIDLPGYGTLAL